MKSRILGSALGLALLGACASTPSTHAVSSAEPMLAAPPATLTATVATDAAPSSLALEVASVTASPEPAAQENTRGYTGIQLYYGPRAYNLGTSNLNTVGIEYANENPDNMVGWEVAVFFAPEDEIISVGNIEADLTEISFGARATFNRDGALKPYFGGGLNWTDIGIEPGNLGDDTFGLYIHFGLLLKFGKLIGLGLDYRVASSLSDLNIGGLDIAGNYDQIALFLAFQF